MICVQGELSTPKVRPQVRAHNNRRQHLSASRTISSLRKAKASAGIGDHHFPIFLNMIQNAPTVKRLASVSKRNRPSSVGSPRMGALIRQALSASNAAC